MTDPSAPDLADERTDIAAYWQRVRHRVVRDPFARLSVVVGSSSATAVAPPAFAFGASREQADELLGLVLDGTKTATSSALVEYRERGEPDGGPERGVEDEAAGGTVPLPRVGDLAIVLDGAGEPRAVVRTTAVEVTTLGRVDAEHAAAEADGDGSLAAWRAAHAALWGQRVDEAGDWPVVLERFTVVHPRPAAGRR